MKHLPHMKKKYAIPRTSKYRSLSDGGQSHRRRKRPVYSLISIPSLRMLAYGIRALTTILT